MQAQPPPLLDRPTTVGLVMHNTRCLLNFPIHLQLASMDDVTNLTDVDNEIERAQDKMPNSCHRQTILIDTSIAGWCKSQQMQNSNAVPRRLQSSLHRPLQQEQGSPEFNVTQHQNAVRCS